ncbi:MAG TPA: HAD-IA family hydrolase [Polyangiaceae bacterium]|nr:HAD-IA family hydrolase [Polyangiaceae bacterium]
MKCQLVAFDCDGVLVDSEPLVNRVFAEVVARGGPVLDVEASLVRFTGVSMAERIAAVRDEYGWTPPRTFERDFDELQRKALQSGLHAVPGVIAAVRTVRTARAVVSNGTLAEMTLKLTTVGLLDAFAPNLFSAAEVARSKPHPDVYLKAIATLGVTAKEAIAVEDSVPGATAALAAGLTVFGYAGKSRDDALARLGARVFHDMTDLPRLLRSAGVDIV